MRLLLDSHLLIWVAEHPRKLSDAARSLILDRQHELVFSAASLWEIAIKQALDRADFRVDARILHQDLIDNGFIELQVTSAHAVATAVLPPIHKDPFDRLLLAQAIVEGLILLTADAVLGRYGDPVRMV